MKTIFLFHFKKVNTALYWEMCFVYVKTLKTPQYIGLTASWAVMLPEQCTYKQKVWSIPKDSKKQEK